MPEACGRHVAAEGPLLGTRVALEAEEEKEEEENAAEKGEWSA
jgi:hypothetical protein